MGESERSYNQPPPISKHNPNLVRQLIFRLRIGNAGYVAMMISIKAWYVVIVEPEATLERDLLLVDEPSLSELARSRDGQEWSLYRTEASGPYTIPRGMGSTAWRQDSRIQQL